MSDIIDDIDALVDEQLSGYHDRSGYDYNVNQDRCHHCEREWHGLKIIARIESMAAHVSYDEDYRYADDDSEVLCPGSSFIRPWATKLQIQAIRTARLVGGVPSVPYTRMREHGDHGIESAPWSAPRIRNNPFSRRNGDLQVRPLGYSLPISDERGWNDVGLVDEFAEFAMGYDEGPHGGVPVLRSGDRIAFIDLDGTRTEGIATVDQSRDLVEIVFDEAAIDRAYVAMEMIARNMAAAFGEIGEMVSRARQALSGWLPEPEPDTRTPQERALPRPSTTPPFWAKDVGTQRRTRTNSRRRHR
ncbi:hypothetical protein R3Q06_31395 [Rhodococcus erythropolis]|uniref:hypothetical protein n=1 Tax=Rhodococcus erythropolis TaxID=1833 RepID=UPI00294A780A|nr:hypothetical protein [Rhodococcus erythropolis]MDV6277991.1 hypothetical protein [Rhodococcus erythropolis]